MQVLKMSILVILILIIAVFTASFIANIMLNNMVKEKVTALYEHVDQNGEIVRSTDLEDLPTPVQRWLEYSQVVDKEKIYAARIEQKAEMKLKVEQNWLPVEAKQYFSVQQPGFIWDADIKLAPLFHIAGRDKYFEGKGNMLIKILSLIPVADASGKEIDQGTLVRFLAETIWFPTAALSDYITWQEMDENTATATMSYKGITASGVFTFNEKGEVVHFEADRYGEFDGEYSLKTWSIPLSDYKEFNGIKIPTRGKVTWELEDGDFNWYNFEVITAEYNILEPF